MKEVLKNYDKTKLELSEEEIKKELNSFYLYRTEKNEN
jgi:hypothetical protein